jgi:class 3 adenylate cyclase
MDFHHSKSKGCIAPNKQRSPFFNNHRAFAFQNAKKTQINEHSVLGLKHNMPHAVVIFCDLSNFQFLTEQYGDMMCTNIVESLFDQFDEMATHLKLTPLKTNGDQYIAVGFCSKDYFNDEALHPQAISAIEFGVKARNLVSSNALLMSSSCHLRVGIATGPLITGHSTRSAMGFDIWGTTVNKAAMLEQFTAPNTIAVCEKTHSVFKMHAGQPFSPITYSVTTLNRCDETIMESGNKITNESLLLKEHVASMAFCSTQIQAKAALLNAYIC